MVHRIDGPGATVGNLFTEGDPSLGTPATTVTDDWLNDVQEELVTLVEAAGLTPTKGQQDQVRQAILLLSALAGSPAVGANLLDNAGFEWWQRHEPSAPVPIAGSGVYPDRWFCDEGGGGVATVEKADQGFSDTALPIGAESNYLQWNQNTGGTNPEFHQRTEYLDAIDGREVTLSFYAKVNSGTINVTPRIRQFFGPTGSAEVVTDGSPITIDTTWTRYTWTVTIPSTNGKSVGGQGQYTAFGLKLPSSATFVLHFGWPKLELGPFASQFMHKTHAAEEAQILRFYRKSYIPGVAPGAVSQIGKIMGGHHGNGNQIWGLTEYLGGAGMRATPNVTWYSPNTGNANRIECPNQTDRTVTSTLHQSRHSTGAPTLSVNPGANEAEAHVTLDAEL